MTDKKSKAEVRTEVEPEAPKPKDEWEAFRASLPAPRRRG